MLDLSIQKGMVKKILYITNLKKVLPDNLWRHTLFLISSHMASWAIMSTLFLLG